jgi:CIC family chloride channel protein
VAKVGATIISYSSGNAGGIFAPSLYIGAMAGGTVGVLVQRFATFGTADPGAYSLVGMGALFAGIIRAPMTSVFMVFEITQDYQILVPLMVANLLSFWISRRFQPTPVYEALLRQDGVHLPATHGRPASGTWTAADVMSPRPPLVDVQRTVDDAAAILRASGAPACLVGDRSHVGGLVTNAELTSAIDDGQGTSAVGSLAHHIVVHVHPDQPFEVVIGRYWETRGVLPVVSRDDIQEVVGLVTLDDITRFVGGSGRAGERP